jgi:hypothetical protein
MFGLKEIGNPESKQKHSTNEKLLLFRHGKLSVVDYFLTIG